MAVAEAITDIQTVQITWLNKVNWSEDGLVQE